MTQAKRKKFLIHPRLQLMTVAVFLAVGALYVLLEATLLLRSVREVGANHPNGTEIVAELLSLLRFNLMAVLLVIVPLTVVLGVFLTHRIVGPIHRFEEHLRAIVRGENPGACQLRSGDELQDFCKLLNQATDTLRQGAVASSAQTEAPVKRSA